MVVVRTGPRLHLGFQNLSLARQRLYGGIGLAIDEPTVRIEAQRAGTVRAPSIVSDVANAAVELLSVPGAEIQVHESLDRHVGLGSGTQHALATLTAIARAYDLDPAVRSRAPSLGRGGRSGIGVATFESGGFVVDGGHPTEQFTTAPPEHGEWSVPPVIACHTVPESWRFVVVVPDGVVGDHGASEDASMRTVVESADPAISDTIATVVTHELLPAVASDSIEQFGQAINAIGRLNGSWYAEQQGGVYRPPAGALITELKDCGALFGVGQSSWGPAVYGLTSVEQTSRALQAVEETLDSVGLEATVYCAKPRNTGAISTDR
ncbi:beta-ribofuranosylaminobenzene 5'-phosphate synthase family protein [Halocatena halophila]|uniref:beta-ribofuranosylaminobenzene 5'-phosphate synthase family protein n=1 Tax=Halocatena halophila TaxID=2814576 RepID=UPI002ED13824